MSSLTVSVQDLLEWTGGQLRAGTPQTRIQGISTDSRTVAEGNLFIALVGEHFDGHTFLPQVIAAGAAALLVERVDGPLSSSLPIIQVSDTLTAIGDIAHGWRKRFPIPVIALTGTSGKTTTKELIRECLATQYSLLATEGNLNNLIGVPKTLFNLDDAHEMAVIEMGMNRFGEIRRLMEIAAPQYGLITNIGAGHTEGVGGIDGVAKAKGELLDGLGEEGCFFANDEDPSITALLDSFPGDIIRYGFSSHCDVVASNVTHRHGRLSFTVRTPWETATLDTVLWGRHHILNALAAITVAQAFQVPLARCAEVLQTASGRPGRGRLIELGDRILLLDEAYNANPLSVHAMLSWFETLDATYTQKWLVFGTMKELGPDAAALHTAVIDAAARAGVTHLYLYGEFANEMSGTARRLGFSPAHVASFSSIATMTHALKEALVPGTALAVKASHSCGFEKMVTELLK